MLRTVVGAAPPVEDADPSGGRVGVLPAFAAAADLGVAAVAPGATDRAVSANSADDQIRAAFSAQDVIALAARQVVLARSPDQEVIPEATLQSIPARAAAITALASSTSEEFAIASADSSVGVLRSPKVDKQAVGVGAVRDRAGVVDSQLVGTFVSLGLTDQGDVG